MMIGSWQKPLRGTRLNFRHPLAQGYLGWIFNELSGGVCTSVGRAQIPMIFAADAPRWQGQYLNFDSGVEYLEDSNLWPFLSPGGDSFTATVKYRTSDTSANKYIFCIDYGIGTTEWWHTAITDGGYFNLGMDDGVAYQSMYISESWDDGEWHTSTVVVDRTAGFSYHYTDGEYRGSVAITAGNIDVASGPLTIGGRSDHSSIRDYIGDLEFIHIHMGIALTGDQVSRLHAEPYCMFERPSRTKYFYVVAEEGRTTKNTDAFPLGHEYGISFRI